MVRGVHIDASAWCFANSEMSAKRIFQLTSRTEKQADCSVGTLKKSGLTRACCIYYSINDANIIPWLRTVMTDCGLRAYCRNSLTQLTYSADINTSAFLNKFCKLTAKIRQFNNKLTQKSIYYIKLSTCL
jgi:hypothetical protein